MLKKYFVVFSTAFLAFGILAISVMRTASIKYDFSPNISKTTVLGSTNIDIDYELPYPGGVLPDHFLWPIKALRDKLWLAITTKESRKIELKLLFADKRLGAAKILFDKGKPELGFSVLTKAEKYLEEASFDEEKNRRENGPEPEVLKKLNIGSLKHFELLMEIINMAPDDAKPKIVELQSYPKRVYERTRNAMNENGITPAENPFEW